MALLGKNILPEPSLSGSSNELEAQEAASMTDPTAHEVEGFMEQQSDAQYVVESEENCGCRLS